MDDEQRVRELVEQLRANGLTNGSSLGRHSGLCEAAADELERLLDELKERKKKLSHVKLMDGLVWELGPYREERVALFNANRITADEAMWYVRSEEYNPNVLVIPKAQWISLFRDGREPDSNE